MTTTPASCRHCPIPQGTHGRQYTDAAGCTEGHAVTGIHTVEQDAWLSLIARIGYTAAQRAWPVVAVALARARAESATTPAETA